VGADDDRLAVLLMMREFQISTVPEGASAYTPPPKLPPEVVAMLSVMRHSLTKRLE
jgi:hypothetical protein